MTPRKLIQLINALGPSWILLLLLLRTDFAVSLNLKGGHQKCSPQQEGEIVSYRMNGAEGTVVNCKCQSGILLECQYPASNAKCDESLAGCHFVERSTGICPKKCQSCNRGSFESGQVRITKNARRTGGGCEASHCFSGVITRSPVLCPPALCKDPIVKPGECCPSCQGCTRGFNEFKEGETKADILDPCNECSCKRGQLTCTRKACPVLPCKEELIKHIKGQCCPVCAEQHGSSSTMGDDKCVFKGKVYVKGNYFQPDSCTNCTCNDNLTVQCSKRTCPPLECDKRGQVFGSREDCCPSCPSEAAAVRPPHCNYRGRIYQDGHSWKDRCKSCSCSDGETKCALQDCPNLECGYGKKPFLPEGACCPECKEENAVCTVFGDPHYRTFDGRIFNFQGSCKYLLAQDCVNGDDDGAGGKNSTFSVRITNDARDSMAFSWLRTVTVRLDGMKVSLMQNMKVKVNAGRVKLPYIKLGSMSIMKDGYRIILRTNKGVRIIWDGVSFLELTVPQEYRNKLCGLCGNFNGDRADDFYGRDGQIYRDGQEFGATWRVGALRACSVLPRDMPHHYEPQCTQSWESKIMSDRNCNAFNSTLFHQCRGKVDPGYYYNACKLDMCECPGETCHCEVLTAYARECERAGGNLVYNWREATNCQNVTSFHWLKDAGSTLGSRRHFYNSSSKSSEESNDLVAVSLAPLEVDDQTEEELRHVQQPDWLLASKSSRNKMRRNRELFAEYLAGCAASDAEMCKKGLSAKIRWQDLTRKERLEIREKRRQLKTHLKRIHQKERRRWQRRKYNKKLRRRQQQRRRRRKQMRSRRRKRPHRRQPHRSPKSLVPHRSSFESLLRVSGRQREEEHEDEGEGEEDLFHALGQGGGGGDFDLSDLIAASAHKVPDRASLAARTPLPLIEDDDEDDQRRRKRRKNLRNRRNH